LYLSDCSSAGKDATVDPLRNPADTSAFALLTDGVHLKLDSRAVPFLLDGRPVVFSERSQELFELNESAAALIARLTQPTSLDVFHRELGNCLASQDDEAETLIADWLDKGIINASFDWDHPYFSSGSSAQLPLDHICVEIRFGSDRFGQSLAAAYSHLRSEGSADLRAAAVPFGTSAIIQVEGRHAVAVPIGEAESGLRSSLVDQVLDSPRCVALHAACMVKEREAVLLMGESGTGKSILAARLGGSRLACSGDDIAMFDPVQGAVKGVPLPLTIKQSGWDLLAGAMPDMSNSPATRRKDGQWVRYLPLPAISPVDWMPVGAIVNLRRKAGAAPSLEPISRIDCLRKLCNDAHSKSGRCSADLLGAMVALVDQAEALQLCYGQAADAAVLLERHFGQ